MIRLAPQRTFFVCLALGALLLILFVIPVGVSAQVGSSASVVETPYNTAAKQIRAYAHHLHDQEQQLEKEQIEFDERVARSKRFLRLHYIILALLELLVVILLFRAYHMHVGKAE